MSIESFPHTFYDIAIDRLNVLEEIHLVKILSIDGRRFTYEIRAALTEEAIIYIKSLIDAAVFSDLIIERNAEGFGARKSPIHLKKHL